MNQTDYESMTLPQIARSTGLPEGTLKHWCYTLGLTKTEAVHRGLHGSGRATGKRRVKTQPMNTRKAMDLQLCLEWLLRPLVTPLAVFLIFTTEEMSWL